MPKPTPAPRDMRALAQWLDKVAAFVDQYDWTGLDVEAPDDLRLIAADVKQMADEVAYDLTEHNLRSELLAEKRDDRHREETDEIRALIGGAR